MPHRQPFDSLEQEVYLGIWRTYDRLRMLEDELFSQFQLTAQQYNCLRLLRAAHPQPLATLQLASRLISRAPDITRMIDKLVKRNLVDRVQPADNRRKILLRITSAGELLLGEIAEPLAQCHHRQLGHMPRAALLQLKQLLNTARHPHESLESLWR